MSLLLHFTSRRHRRSHSSSRRRYSHPKSLSRSAGSITIPANPSLPWRKWHLVFTCLTCQLHGLSMLRFSNAMKRPNYKICLRMIHDDGMSFKCQRKQGLTCIVHEKSLSNPGIFDGRLKAVSLLRSVIHFDRGQKPNPHWIGTILLSQEKWRKNEQASGRANLQGLKYCALSTN